MTTLSTAPRIALPVPDPAAAARAVYDTVMASGRGVTRVAQFWWDLPGEVKFGTAVLLGPIGMLIRTGLRADTWRSHTVENLAAIGVSIAAGLWAVPVALALLIVALRGQTTSAACCARALTGGREFVARHEAGHMAGAMYSGGHSVRARVYATGGGLTKAKGIVTAYAELVALQAGRRAVGSNFGASWDQNRERTIYRKEIPAKQRGAVRRSVFIDTGRALSRYAGARQRWVEQLIKHGRVSA